MQDVRRRRRATAAVFFSAGSLALVTPATAEPTPEPEPPPPDDAANVADAALVHGDERVLRSDTYPSDEDRSLELDGAGAPVATLGTADSESRTDDDPAHRSTVVDVLPNDGTRFAAIIEERPEGDEIVFPLEIVTGVDAEILASGQVLFTRDGDVVGVIDEPWAVDAAGALVATHYELRDGALVQQIALGDPSIVYPVIADPTYWNIPTSTPISTAGTATNYTRGTYRPASDFSARRGYYPVWGSNQGATRVVRRSGECSWYPDTGPYWDFQIPCKSHDYCWDLIRVAKVTSSYGKVAKSDCDNDFLAAMRDHCNQRGWTTRALCNAEATLVYNAVRPFNP